MNKDELITRNGQKMDEGDILIALDGREDGWIKDAWIKQNGTLERLATGSEYWTDSKEVGFVYRDNEEVLVSWYTTGYRNALHVDILDTANSCKVTFLHLGREEDPVTIDGVATLTYGKTHCLCTMPTDF